MKKLTSVVLGIILFASAAPVAFASVAAGCTPTDTNTCEISGGGGVPSLLMMPWGLTGGQTPIYQVGQTASDKYGNKYPCPSWFPVGGCYDITSTNYYLSQVHGFLNIQ